MSFLLNSFVRVNNLNLKSFNKVGVVCASGSKKTTVQFPSGSVIEFLNYNLTLHKPVQDEEVSRSPRKFKETVGKFILWSPQSNKPPKVIHTTLSKAHEAQKAMAERCPQQEFYIMKAVSKMRMERKVELRPVVTEY